MSCPLEQLGIDQAITSLLNKVQLLQTAKNEKERKEKLRLVKAIGHELVNQGQFMKELE